MSDGKWMCPTCRWTVIISGRDRTLSNELRKQEFDHHFPTHADCELRKPVGEIDFDKLKRIP